MNKQLDEESVLPASEQRLTGLTNNMKKPRSKKIIFIVISVIVLLSIVIGISYALWQVTLNQETINLLASDCLTLELTSTNSSGITLESTYPITDSEAENLTPYTFTITNTCKNTAYYMVNLEIMDADNRLNSKYIAVDLGGGKKLLSDYLEGTPTYSDKTFKAVEAREIVEYGVLLGNSSTTYNLKLWMDESVTTSDDVMNKSFTSKISVTATQDLTTPTLAKYVSILASSDTKNLSSSDNTDDKNIRYIGSNPDNYLCFDSNCTNGKWRIIGVMNNMTTSTGDAKSLVKIISNYSIGTNAWDSNNVNDWENSSLKNYLNGDWYTANFADYDDLVESVVWNLGGYVSAGYTANSYYTYERGTRVYDENPTTWTGKVALVYPSDYGFATSGGDTGRDVCLSYDLKSWYLYSDCYKNDFVYYSWRQWTLMTYTTYSNRGFVIFASGDVGSLESSTSISVRPTLYLNSLVKVISGNGTSDNPWIIGF